jgi:hypothetical protein
MLETPHVVVGAAIAARVVNPLLAIPLAFISHFVLDRVPHWNPHISTEKRLYGHITKKSVAVIVGDAGLALAVGTVIATTTAFTPGMPITIEYFDWSKFALTMACCFASVLPDLLEAPYFFMDSKSGAIAKLMEFQKSIQNDANPTFGLLTQILTIGAALLWIYG